MVSPMPRTTTLHEAATIADYERLRMLIERGADPLVSMYGETPLHVVGVARFDETGKDHHDCYGYTECVRLLREHISIFDPRWMRERSPLHFICACDFGCDTYYGHHWKVTEESLAPFLPDELISYVQSFFDVSAIREMHQRAHKSLNRGRYRKNGR